MTVDLVVCDVLNIFFDGFVFGKDNSALNDLLNPLKPLRIVKNLNGLINDYLKGLKPVIFDPLDNGI